LEIFQTELLEKFKTQMKA